MKENIVKGIKTRGRHIQDIPSSLGARPLSPHHYALRRLHQLPDRKSAPKEPKDARLYMGNSYLVEIPERLERSTRALTCTAVTKVMEG